MKKYLNYKLPVFGLMIMLLASCYSGQDVAPIDSPDDNSLVTITPDGDYSSIKEGDILTYTISVDKMVTNDVTFGLTFGDNSVVSASDVSVTGGVLAAFSSSTTISVEILADDFPEVAEAADISIDASGDLAWNFQLSPLSDVEKVAGSVTNVFDATAMTVAVGWPDDHDDWDCYINDSADAGVDASESGADPEIMFLPADAADGNYYVEAYPWAVDASVTEFTISVNYPDGTFEAIKMTFDDSKADTYVEGAGGYRLATITKSGSSSSIAAAF